MSNRYFFNGVLINTIEELEYQMDLAGINEQQKQFARNDFNGIPNTPIQTAIIISSRQIRLGLVQFGVNLTDVSNLINSLPEPTKTYANILWEYSTEFHRDDETLNQLAPLLGFTEETLDQLFNLAVTL